MSATSPRLSKVLTGPVRRGAVLLLCLRPARGDPQGGECKKLRKDNGLVLRFSQRYALARKCSHSPAASRSCLMRRSQRASACRAAIQACTSDSLYLRRCGWPGPARLTWVGQRPTAIIFLAVGRQTPTRAHTLPCDGCRVLRGSACCLRNEKPRAANQAGVEKHRVDFCAPASGAANRLCHATIRKRVQNA